MAGQPKFCADGTLGQNNLKEGITGDQLTKSSARRKPCKLQSARTTKEKTHQKTGLKDYCFLLSPTLSLGDRQCHCHSTTKQKQAGCQGDAGMSASGGEGAAGKGRRRKLRERLFGLQRRPGQGTQRAPGGAAGEAASARPAGYRRH